MRAYERFLTYAKIHTMSDENSGVTPSSSCQWELARLLEKELKELGVSDVKLDEQWCIVTGHIPATPGCENAPALGLLAHMDTAPAFSGKDVVNLSNANGGESVFHKNVKRTCGAIAQLVCNLRRNSRIGRCDKLFHASLGGKGGKLFEEQLLVYFKRRELIRLCGYLILEPRQNLTHGTRGKVNNFKCRKDF